MKVPGKRALGWVICTILLGALSLHAAPAEGRLSGVVVDPAGTPQMGATVWVLAENIAGAQPAQLLTNERGAFAPLRLAPGLYSIRVTLAGFLPSVERHVRVISSVTTLVKIELETAFSSLDRLRRPSTQTDADEWKWVLRTSAATRPILQWLDGEALDAGQTSAAEKARRNRPRGRLELTSGARRPGSVSNLADSPATAMSYDQRLGRAGRLLMAGQFSFEGAPAAGFSTIWLPSGEVGVGPQTTLVLREARLGPSGPTFRAARMDHSSRLLIGDHLVLKYGAEYILVGLGGAASSLRPRGALDLKISPDWSATFTVASLPTNFVYSDEFRAGALQSVLAQLDSLPAVMLRDGRPVLEGGWHEEFAVEHRLSKQASLIAAGFHDRARHLALFGRGDVAGPDFLQDAFSDGFLYDGGGTSSWGTRLAYRQKFSDEFEAALVYAWAGAQEFSERTTGISLREAIETRNRHSLALRVAGRVPRLKTRVAASYKWVNGEVLTRQDMYGEALYQLDPSLNLIVRQPLPRSLFGGKLEALADCRNLLAQGYVSLSSREGRVVLVPAARSFRGGVSFQF